jgi:hypothetical protein
MKAVEYTKAAYTAYTSLEREEKSKADRLVNLLIKNEDLEKVYSFAPFKVVDDEGDKIYALNLNDKLRVFVKIEANQITVIDILNAALIDMYFNNKAVA